MEAGWSVEQLGGPKGRGVLARRAFQPGDLVLEDRALGYAVVGSSTGSVCDCCLAPSSGPLRCDLQGRQRSVQVGHIVTRVTMRTPARQSRTCGCSLRPPPPIAAAAHCRPTSIAWCCILCLPESLLPFVPATHRCSACKLVCYKSKEHQARAWRAGHREECAALRACAPRVPPTAVRLALRCALRHWRAQQAQQQQAQSQQGQQDVQPNQRQGDSNNTLARYDELLQLQHHWDALLEGSKLQFAQMGALAHRLLEAAAPEAAEATSPRDLALLLARFGANSHTIRCEQFSGGLRGEAFDMGLHLQDLDARPICSPVAPSVCSHFMLQR